VGSRGCGVRLLPPLPQRLKTGHDTHTVLEDLPGDQRIADLDRVLDAKLQRVPSGLTCQGIDHLLLSDCCLRHSEAAKRPARCYMCVDGTRMRSIVGHVVWSTCVDRDAVGH